MAVPYLHGVETLILDKGPRPVQVVKSAVIGLVGIAPTGAKNELILVSGDSDAAQFGAKLPGFNIPQALDFIFKQGAGTVLVVNVFDVATHTTQVTLESQTVAAGKLKLASAPIGTVNVFDNSDQASTLIPGTDYSIDAFGNFVALSATVTNGMVLKFSYKKLNGAAVTTSHINGSIDGTSGARTGMKCFSLGKNLYGFNPKILIAPNFSSTNAIATEMIVQAEALRAVTFLDAPYGTTVSQAISGRGVASTINFKTSSKRAFLLYPYLKAYDEASNSNIDFPYSSFMAGVLAATDNELGFWNSPSNKEIKGIVGAERNISAALNDANADANKLNEAGITTIFNTFGTGIRTWGNRNASFPTNTSPDNFLSILRISDVVHESMENASLQFIDRPITQALIDAIRETGNSFIRTLIQRGALVSGSRVEFPKDVNTPTEIAAGHLTYDLIIMGSVPGERITFRSYIDITLLTSLQ